MKKVIIEWSNGIWIFKGNEGIGMMEVADNQLINDWVGMNASR